MKKPKFWLKTIGIITLVAVIGFSMAACGDDNDDNGGGGGGSGGGGSGWSDWKTAQSDRLDSQTSGITIHASISGNIASSIEVEVEGLSTPLIVVNGYSRDVITAYDPAAKNPVKLRYKPSSAKCTISGSSVYFSD